MEKAHIIEKREKLGDQRELGSYPKFYRALVKWFSARNFRVSSIKMGAISTLQNSVKVK